MFMARTFLTMTRSHATLKQEMLSDLLLLCSFSTNLQDKKNMTNICGKEQQEESMPRFLAMEIRNEINKILSRTFHDNSPGKKLMFTRTSENAS